MNDQSIGFIFVIFLGAFKKSLWNNNICGFVDGNLNSINLSMMTLTLWFHRSKERLNYDIDNMIFNRDFDFIAAEERNS